MNLAIITYAMPLLLARAPYNQVLNMVSFWLMTGGIAFMTFVLTFAGTIQTHMQRVVGDYFMNVQDSLSIFYMMRFGAGIAVVLGAVLFIYSQFAVRREIIEPGPSAQVAAE
jgi:nitric oxide reductase subunit B